MDNSSQSSVFMVYYEDTNCIVNKNCGSDRIILAAIIFLLCRQEGCVQVHHQWYIEWPMVLLPGRVLGIRVQGERLQQETGYGKV